MLTSAPWDPSNNLDGFLSLVVLASALRSGSLRSRVAAGHGGDEVVGAAGGSGDLGFSVAAVESDGGVAQDRCDGGSGAGMGPGGRPRRRSGRGPSAAGSRCAIPAGPIPVGQRAGRERRAVTSPGRPSATPSVSGCSTRSPRTPRRSAAPGSTPGSHKTSPCTAPSWVSTSLATGHQMATDQLRLVRCMCCLWKTT